MATGLSEPRRPAIANGPSTSNISLPSHSPGNFTTYPVTCFPTLSPSTTGYTVEVLVSICGRFAPLLPSNRAWEPVDASRYGVARPERLSFPASATPGASADLVLPLAERMLACNRYLLDGFVREGLPCAYRKRAPIENIYFVVC